MSATEDLERFFSALHRHRALIIETHLQNNGFVNETSDNDKAVSKLIKLGVFWRMDDEHGRVRLSQAVTDILNVARRDELRRHVNVDIGERLNDLEDLVASYRKAKRFGTIEEQDLAYQVMEEQVYGLREALSVTSRHLWKEIESEFAYVTTLELKLQENQRVLEKVKRLNENLGLLDYQTLSSERFAGEDPRLRKLFTGSLVQQISNIREELVDAIYRLDAMLFAFRIQHRQGRIVQAFGIKFQREPGFSPSNYAGQTQIPRILNQVEPLLLGGHADLDSDKDEMLLTKLIRNLRKHLQQTPPAEESARIKVADTMENAAEDIDVDALNQAVQTFYLSAADGKPVTAMSLFELAPEDCPEHIWLFAVAARHNMMSPDELGVFTMKYIDESDPVFNGLLKVSDIQVSIR